MSTRTVKVRFEEGWSRVAGRTTSLRARRRGRVLRAVLAFLAGAAVAFG